MMGKVLMLYVPDLLLYTEQPILFAKEKLRSEMLPRSDLLK